jgi:hypothetical protein
MATGQRRGRGGGSPERGELKKRGDEEGNWQRRLGEKLGLPEAISI